MTSDRLDSWKEIAAYLRRSVRTVTRWEREEGLPIHRHLHSKSGTVYAFKPELGAWWTNRGAEIDREPPGPPSGWLSRARHSRRLAAAVIGALCLAGLAWFILGRSSRPAVASRLVPLTTYPGIEGPPSLSPD